MQLDRRRRLQNYWGGCNLTLEKATERERLTLEIVLQ